MNDLSALKARADRGDVEAMYEYGASLYLETEDWDTALVYLQQAAAEKYVMAYEFIGLILSQSKNDPDQAEKWFKMAEAEHCLSGAAAHEYGLLLYLKRDDLENPLKYFYQAAAEGYKSVYGYIGIFLYEKGDIINAEKWFKKAEKANTLYPFSAYEYGNLLYWEKKKPKKALKYLYQAAEAEYELAYAEIGVILSLMRKNYDEAERWFIKAEQAGLLPPYAACEYAMLLDYEKNDEEKALPYYYQAAKENCTPAYGQLGIILYEKHKVEEAEEWFKKAEEADSLFTPAAYEYGMLLKEERGNEEKALELLLAAANDEYIFAYGEVGALLYRKGDVAGAEKWFARAEKEETIWHTSAREFGNFLLNEKNDKKLAEYYFEMAENEGC